MTQRDIDLAKAGDLPAFERLVEHFQPMVESVALGFLARHEDVQDCVQETFLRAYTALPALRSSVAFPVWLMSIARTTALNQRDKRSRRREVTLDVPEADRAGPEPSSANEPLEVALRELEPRKRQLLLLHYFDELPVARIAELLSSPEGSVKRLLHEARAQLRELLQPADVKVRLAEHAPELRRQIMDEAPIVKFTNILLLTAFKENAIRIVIDPSESNPRVSLDVLGQIQDIPPATPRVLQGACDRLWLLSGGKSVSIYANGVSRAVQARREPDGRMTVEIGEPDPSGRRELPEHPRPLGSGGAGEIAGAAEG